MLLLWLGMPFLLLNTQVTHLYELLKIQGMAYYS